MKLEKKIKMKSTEYDDFMILKGADKVEYRFRNGELEMLVTDRQDLIDFAKSKGLKE